METIIVNASAFPLGLKIYNEGGNSGSYAKLTLTAALTAPLPKAGDAVTGVNSAAGEVSGKVLDNYVAGSTTLNVAYAVSDVQVTHVTCKVGGLPTASTITTGCKFESSLAQHQI